MPKAPSIGWWERCVERITTHWRDVFEVGGEYKGQTITEIAQRGSHHHRPDNYDLFSGDRLIKCVSDRDIADVDFANLPAPAHQTFIPGPSTRSNTPPEGERWCPLTRQPCWGKGCAIAHEGGCGLEVSA
jgi:hypothetical protein